MSVPWFIVIVFLVGFSCYGWGFENCRKWYLGDLGISDDNTFRKAIMKGGAAAFRKVLGD